MPGAEAAAVAAAIARAIRASGTLVQVEPEELLRLVERNPEALVVIAPCGFLGNKKRYLMGYRGLAFYADSAHDLPLAGAEVVTARRIWIP